MKKSSNANYILRINNGENLAKKDGIIECILKSDLDGVKLNLSENPNCINDIHEYSGMNAPMLASHARMTKFLECILEYSKNLDFLHTDNDGCDLLRIAIRSFHQPTIDAVQHAYEASAAHLINNWPEP